MEIYDPLYGRLSVPPAFSAIVDSPQFRRLQHVRQLGLCYLSFPGGNHTRFEHSVGAQYLAGWLRRSAEKSGPLDSKGLERLVLLLQLGALCHDIGHGPFSHMVENVLVGMGANISHEQMGAALVYFELPAYFEAFALWDVEAIHVSRLLLHDAGTDQLIRCAEDMISSELDVDRIDYLHRDRYYATGEITRGDHLVRRLESAWQLRSYGINLRFELTLEGVQFAEELLFMRRNSYKNIVYESRHMAATAMFEKAVALAAAEGGPLNGLVKELSSLPPLMLSEASRQAYAAARRLYGMVDFEAIAALLTGPTRVRNLIQDVRSERFYESVCRVSWERLHPVARQRLAVLRSEREAFLFRRKVEDHLAAQCSVEAHDVAAHIPRFPGDRFTALGVEDGRTLGDVPIIAFLRDDTLRHYAIEVFVDPLVARKNRDDVAANASDMFTRGQLAADVS